jgi:DNA-binding transcriptional MocR family regulator
MTPADFAPAFAEPAGSPIRELFPYLGRPGMISFAGGYPSPALLDAEGLQAASQRAWTDRTAALQYSATEGLPVLRDALSLLSRRRGVACEAADVLVSTGSQQAFDLLVRILLQPGELVLLEAPAYPAAIQSVRLAGARIEQVAVDDQGLRVDLLAASLHSQSARPKFLYTVPTFSNPSGATLCAERREALVRLALERGFLVIEDDPYGEIAFGHERLPTLYEIGQSIAGASNPVIYLSSLSKTVAPALRIGWMVASTPVLRRAAVAKQTMDLCTSPLAQLIAANYLQSGRYPEAVAKACREYGERMAAMTAGIQDTLAGRLRCAPSRGGLFLWAEWDASGADPKALFHAAVEAGVLFVPGGAFYADGEARHAMRLSYAAPDTIQIHEGVQRLARAFEETPSR